jgi:hypothetical protein
MNSASAQLFKALLISSRSPPELCFGLKQAYSITPCGSRRREAKATRLLANFPSRGGFLFPSPATHPAGRLKNPTLRCKSVRLDANQINDFQFY